MEPEDAFGRLRGRRVVLDMVSPFVILGTLAGENGRYIELEDADVHDLRDAKATRERYVVDSLESGVKVNRRRVLIPRDQVVSIAATEDVIG